MPHLSVEVRMLIYGHSIKLTASGTRVWHHLSFNVHLKSNVKPSLIVGVIIHVFGEWGYIPYYVSLNNKKSNFLNDFNSRNKQTLSTTPQLSTQLIVFFQVGDNETKMFSTLLDSCISDLDHTLTESSSLKRKRKSRQVWTLEYLNLLYLRRCP